MKRVKKKHKKSRCNNRSETKVITRRRAFSSARLKKNWEIKKVLNIFAKNRRKNLEKHRGPPFQIRPGPGYFSIADISGISKWNFIIMCSQQSDSCDSTNLSECYVKTRFSNELLYWSSNCLAIFGISSSGKKSFRNIICMSKKQGKV
jgi:hypothetical protein